MRKVKLNGNMLNVVDRWDELRLKHLIGLEKIDAANEADVFSVLSGVPIMVVENAEAITNEIYKTIEFIYTQTPEWDKLKPPTHLVIDGKPYKIPSPDKCLLGQNIMLDNLMEKTLLEIIPRALAIYFQPLVDGGKFDRHRLDYIEGLINEANAIDCYAVANFFLRSGKNLSRITRVGYLLKSPTQLQPSQMTEAMPNTDASSGSTT